MLCNYRSSQDLWFSNTTVDYHCRLKKKKKVEGLKPDWTFIAWFLAMYVCFYPHTFPSHRIKTVYLKTLTYINNKKSNDTIEFIFFTTQL